VPKFNADAPSLFEAIEVVLEGKTYVVKSITSKMMRETTKLIKEAEASEDVDSSFRYLSRQVRLFLEVPEKTLEKVDMRKLVAIVRFITETVTDRQKGDDEEGKEPGSKAKK